MILENLNLFFNVLYTLSDILSTKKGGILMASFTSDTFQSTQTHSIYILLTRSETWFSRLIHLVTSDCYTHASIGLDGPSGPFYSFARKHKHFALPAGLVEERPGIRNRQIPCCLYKLKVSDSVYRRLRQQLSRMYHQRELYHYNLLGVLSCYFNRPLRRKNHYFCSQFVATLLEECGAVELWKNPDLVRPADFCRLAALQAVHKGPLDSLMAAPT